MKPGSIGLSHIGGRLGLAIQIGQIVAGDPSYWTHAFVVLDDDTVLEAEPSGARIVPLAPYLAPGVAVFFEPVTDPETLQRIVDRARAHVGDLYGFWSYPAIGLARLGIRPKWLTRYIASSDSSICSALCDRVYAEAGVHLFTDGRPYGMVTPGSLDRLRLANSTQSSTVSNGGSTMKLNDATRRGLRTALQGLVSLFGTGAGVGVLALFGVHVELAQYLAVAGVLLPFVTVGINALEDNTAFPAILKAPTSPGVNPTPNPAPESTVETPSANEDVL